jgi:hypothetical protein
MSGCENPQWSAFEFLITGFISIDVFISALGDTNIPSSLLLIICIGGSIVILRRVLIYTACSILFCRIASSLFLEYAAAVCLLWYFAIGLFSRGKLPFTSLA